MQTAPEHTPEGGFRSGLRRIEGAAVVMNNLKRFTVCKLAGHKWLRVAYPPGADGEDPETFFLRCRRCGKENHNVGTVPGSTATDGGGGGL